MDSKWSPKKGVFVGALLAMLVLENRFLLCYLKGFFLFTFGCLDVAMLHKRKEGTRGW